MKQKVTTRETLEFSGAIIDDKYIGAASITSEMVTRFLHNGPAWWCARSVAQETSGTGKEQLDTC